MTEELFREDGVLLQYAGDGIQACWNAPFPSGDHADRACRAALAMRRRLAEIDPELRCGIGLQAGRVVAGTDGSDQIFAYGVIGAAVAQAARVEGLTKLVGAPVLATRDVVDRLSDASGVAAMPLGKFRSAGMPADFDLYEIAAGPPDPDRLAAFEDAEAALAAGAWDAAVEALKGPAAQDAAARYLLGFAEKCLRAPPRNWSGVIELGEK
jgi:adenylate cyclase